MSNLSSTYYDRPIGHAIVTFANLVEIREYIEDSLNIGYQGLSNVLRIVIK